MRIRFPLGLIVWTSVWLLVALVPLWRLRAQRQWSNPTVSVDFYGNDYGLTGDLEREVARRFPGDVAAQLAPLHGVRSQDLYPEPPKSGEGIQVLPPKPVGQSLDAPAKTLQQRAVAYFAHYDELERRFPASNAVRAQRLRETTWGQLVVHEGPLPKGEVALPSADSSPVWLARPELQSALRSAREGARREPDNGFYPWMEAVLQFSLDRPDDAIKALDAAGKCGHWSDDTRNTFARRTALLRRVRAVGWEDSTQEAWQMLYPHLSSMRRAARAATGQMRLARRRGDEARALQIAGVLARAGANMSRNNDTLIGQMVGEAICSIAWAAAIEDQPNAPRFPVWQGQPTRQQERETLQIFRRQRLKVFAAYARAHGRSDLAREAEHIEPTLDSQTLEALYDSPGFDSTLSRGRSLSNAFWLGAWLLRLALAASLVWIATFLLTRRREPQPRGERAKNVAWAFFCLGATAALLSALIASEAGLVDTMGSFPDLTPEPPRLAVLKDNLPLFLGLLWLVPVVGSSLLEHAKAWKPVIQRGATNWRRVISAALWSVFLGGLLIGWQTQNVAEPSVWSQDLVYFSVLWLLTPVVGSALFIAWAPQKSRMARILGVGAFWMAGLSALVSSTSPGETPFYWFAWGMALVMAFFLFFFGQRDRASTPGDAWSSAFDFAAQARMAASVLALGATLGYLGVSLWTIPVERGVGVLLNHQLRIGESAFLREQLQNHS
jgi:MFS family permease